MSSSWWILNWLQYGAACFLLKHPHVTVHDLTFGSTTPSLWNRCASLNYSKMHNLIDWLINLLLSWIKSWCIIFSFSWLLNDMFKNEHMHLYLYTGAKSHKKNLLLYLSVVISAAPQFSLCVKQSVLSPVSLDLK